MNVTPPVQQTPPINQHDGPDAQEKPQESEKGQKPLNEAAYQVKDLLRLRIALDQSKSLSDSSQVCSEFIGSMFSDAEVFVSFVNDQNKLKLTGVHSAQQKSEAEKIELEKIQQEVFNLDSEATAVGWPEVDEWNPSLIQKSWLLQSQQTAVVSQVIYFAG